MPKKKAILFIDGSNFYHALKQNKFFNIFSFKDFFDELSTNFQITKVYYYDALKNSQLEPEQYSKQQHFHRTLEKEIPVLVVRSRKLKYILVNDRVEKAKTESKFCVDCKPKIGKFLSKAGLLKMSKEKVLT